MTAAGAFYDLYPQIVPAGRETTIVIRPLFDHVAFAAEEEIGVSLVPVGGHPGEVRWDETLRMSFRPVNGELRVPCHFDGEQEYVLALEPSGRRPVEFHLYALEPDLLARRPFKGDFHMHTYYSDGVESPAYVAAACRKIGLDFMAITDHARYAPSLEAIRAFEGLPIDLRIYPGEEVHAPDNRVHILNFGGEFSVNELLRGESYLAEVNAIASGLRDFPAGVDPYPFASCVWCFEQIRRGGGLAVFCHPYWISRRRYDVPEALIDLIFDRQPYDALELIGGYHRHEVESNLLQVLRYHEERAAGKRIPIVGVSDAHGCETGSLFGWYYTLAFAPSTDLPDLVTAIKDLYSVAVEALPGEAPRAHGPFRLARYAQFLLREVLPAHDELCRAEGEWMLAYASGNEQACDHLAALRGRVDAFYSGKILSGEKPQ